MRESQEVVARLGFVPIAYTVSKIGAWDWLLVGPRGQCVGYNGPRPELPFIPDGKVDSLAG